MDVDGEDLDAEEHDATVAARLIEMLVGRELERIARSLERKLGAPPEEADDAVCDAVVRTLAAESPPAPSKVGAFVFRTAQHRIIDQHRSRRAFDDAAPDLYQEHDGGRLADHVIGEDVFRRIRATVEKWDNANVRAVTLAFLDAVYDGEELDYHELAERASAARGESLSPDSVRVWKSRGVKRLQAEFIEPAAPKRTTS